MISTNGLHFVSVHKILKKISNEPNNQSTADGVAHFQKYVGGFTSCGLGEVGDGILFGGILHPTIIIYECLCRVSKCVQFH